MGTKIKKICLVLAMFIFRLEATPFHYDQLLLRTKNHARTRL